MPPLATDGEHFCFQFWIFPFAFSYKILKYSVPDNKTINFAIFGFLFLCMVWRGGSERSHRCFCFYFYSFIFSHFVFEKFIQFLLSNIWKVLNKNINFKYFCSVLFIFILFYFDLFWTKGSYWNTKQKQKMSRQTQAKTKLLSALQCGYMNSYRMKKIIPFNGFYW